MNDRHVLIAFLATLASIVALVITGAIMAAHGRPAEALGIGGAVTGLIGVIGTFRPKTAAADGQKVEIDQPENKPVPVDQAP